MCTLQLQWLQKLGIYLLPPPGKVICLELGADLHMAQLMPLPLTVSCFSKIQIGFTFLVPAHLGSPEKRAVKRVYVCVGETFVFLSYLARKLQTCYVGMTVLLYSCITKSASLQTDVFAQSYALVVVHATIGLDWNWCCSPQRCWFYAWKDICPLHKPLPIGSSVKQMDVQTEVENGGRQ